MPSVDWGSIWLAVSAAWAQRSLERQAVDVLAIQHHCWFRTSIKSAQPSNYPITSVAMAVVMVNTGAPSAIQDYACNLIFPSDKKTVSGKIFMSKSDLTLEHEGGGSVAIHPDGYLFLKTLVPLQRGELRNGMILFAFARLPYRPVQASNATIELVATDVFGRKYHLTKVFSVAEARWVLNRCGETAP